MSSDRPKRRSRPTAVLLLALSLSGMLVFAAGIAPRTVTCALCHRAPTAARSQTVHATVSCSACHARPGLSGWLEARAFEAQVMYPSAIGLSSSGAGAGAGAVSSDRCMACHGSIDGEVVLGGGIRVRHETCIDEGVRCVDCHQGVGHGPVEGRVLGASMGDCTTCHDGRQASDECFTCHIEGEDERSQGTTLWRITHGENWELTHGMGDLTTCMACHSQGDCADCHFDQPHPRTWPADHGAAAASVESIAEACWNCHRQAYCDSCHQVEMPHPADWRPRHLKETKGFDDERCVRCHSTQDCVDCHEMHAHPGRIDLGKRR